MLILKNDKYEFVMRDDSTYSLKSVDNPHVYNREYLFAEEETHVSSKHGIVINSQNGESYSCILLAGGGASSVHKNSALIHENKCIVGVSCYMCSLHLPTLDLEWHTQTDWQLVLVSIIRLNTNVLSHMASWRLRECLIQVKLFGRRAERIYSQTVLFCTMIILRQLTSMISSIEST